MVGEGISERSMKCEDYTLFWEDQYGANAFSCPTMTSSEHSTGEQVITVELSGTDMAAVLATISGIEIAGQNSISQEQLKDPNRCVVMEYLKEKKLPEDAEDTRHVVLQSALFAMLDDVLFYCGTKRDIHRVAVINIYTMKS